jgi:MFS family permease
MMEEQHDGMDARTSPPQFERVVWYREPHLRKLYSLSILLLVASATTGYDAMLVNTQQQMDFFKSYFGDNIVDSQRLGVLINMFNIGSILSFFITPHMADNLGRRPTIAAGCVIMVLGALLCAFCNGYGMYIGGRFVLGFGNSLAQMSSPMLLTEICHPQHRGPVTAVYNCLWNLGSVGE